MAEITVNGVALASPVSISNSDEIIWSSGTGRRCHRKQENNSNFLGNLNSR